MASAKLEHVNITVKDADAMAAMLCNLFGWHVRWEGSVLNGSGRSVHVGSHSDYLAIYEPAEGLHSATASNYLQSGGLNHVGLLVDDLDATEAKVRAAGYTPHLHADYEPGRRFYFDGPEGIEFEVISYD